MDSEKLLDILAKERMETALEAALKGDYEYQHELEVQDAAFGRIKEMMLDGEQETVVDRAISATNNCGTLYGITAYKQGLRDGVKLICELRATA